MTRWENLFRETNCKQHETPLRSANKLFAKFIRKLPDSEVIKCSEKEQNKKPWLFWRYAVCLESIYWSDSFGWLEFCGTSRALRWNDFPLSRSSIYAMQKSLKIRIKFHLISLSTYIRSLSFQRDIKKLSSKEDATALADCWRNIYDSRFFFSNFSLHSSSVRRKQVDGYWFYITNSSRGVVLINH